MLVASEGIGAAGDPIVVEGRRRLSRVERAAMTKTARRRSRRRRRASSCATRAAAISRSSSRGELAGVRSWTAARGDIEIANEAGGIDVAAPAREADRPRDGPGGDSSCRWRPAARSARGRRSFANAAAIASGGTQTYDGDVVLARATEVESDGDIEILGGLDASETRRAPVVVQRPRSATRRPTRPQLVVAGRHRCAARARLVRAERAGGRVDRSSTPRRSARAAGRPTRRPRARADRRAHRGRRDRLRGRRDERRAGSRSATPAQMRSPDRRPERDDGRATSAAEPGRAHARPGRSHDREGERQPLAHEQRRRRADRRRREAQRGGPARDRRATRCASPISPRSTSR